MTIDYRWKLNSRVVLGRNDLKAILFVGVALLSNGIQFNERMIKQCRRFKLKKANQTKTIGT